MDKPFKYVCFFMLIISQFALANTEKYSNEVSLSLGMSSISFAENEKTIQGENVSEIVTGSVSAISMSVQYDFNNNMNYHDYISMVFPILPSSTGQFVDIVYGRDFYFNGIASTSSFRTDGTSISFKPNFRYYAGYALGAGYLVYNTETATKSDIIFEIGGKGGASYSVMENLDLKLDLFVLKGVGVVTSSMVTKVFIGAAFTF